VTRSDTRAGRYAGPPGDTTAYYLPRDMKVWEQAWDRYLGESAPLETLSTSRRGQGEADMSPEAVAARAEAKHRQAEALAYVASYTGSWGLPLDIRANPRWGTKYMKLSERQVEVLLEGKARDLARAEQLEIAHELYAADQYEEATRVSQRAQSPEAAGLAAQPSPGAGMGRDVLDGWYLVDGQPWKVQWNRERTRKYAKRLVLSDPDALRQPGDRVAPGSWEYVQGGLGVVARKGEPMTTEHAEEFGKLYGVCAVCGQTLTNETSIARGIGPVCYAKIGGTL
jgi:uncharacterized protein DUF6011